MSTEYLLFGANKEMLGIAADSPIHLSEDENMPIASADEGDDGEQVEGPLALVLVGEDEDET